MQKENKTDFKFVNIRLDVGVGFYRCGLSALVYESTRTACIVDTQARSGAAIISLKNNPGWAKLLDTADNNETIVIDGSTYEVDLMHVNGLRLKNGKVTKFPKGIICPKAHDYIYKIVFREPYFGKDRDLPIEQPYIVKTGQINEYQVYQRGFTYTIRHDDVHAWADGRLRYEVLGVYREDVKSLTYKTKYTTFNENMKKQYDRVKMLEEDDKDNYLNRLQHAVYTAWQDNLDIRETVKEEFADSLYADYL